MVLKHCITCNCLNSKRVLTVKTADLPIYRLNYTNGFKVVGVAFSNPIYCQKIYSSSKDVNKF